MGGPPSPPSPSNAKHLNLLSDFDEILYEKSLLECWLKIKTKI